MTFAGAGNQFGDTTLTKVFVGGLAWETQKEILREHFDKYGEILEAVIINDKATGRSKGYGFVTFKDAEAAKKACEDATPVINGRRANCNLASLGARRAKPVSTASPHTVTTTVGSRPLTTAPASPAQWYYPQGNALPPFNLHHQSVPYNAYGYPPTYMAHFGYNQKLSYSGGSHVNGHFPMVYSMNPNTIVPVYPYYHFHHQSQNMGSPTPIFPPVTTGIITNMPTFVSKPIVVTPKKGTCMQLNAIGGEKGGDGGL